MCNKEKKPLNILIGEYAYTSKMILSKIFNELGHDINIVTNGDEIIPLYLGHSFDLIFLDVLLGKKGAIKVAKELIELGCKIPIVALSSNLQPGDLQSYLDAGMVDCISKPFKIEQFDQTIKKYYSASP
ncbi:MAG: response regulator [Flavobacteriaceae bacterium]|nr:response regulator [Flavobacteriaceae bacterium]